MQVVGKRHYGLKALPSEGEAAAGHPRLFDRCLLWKGRIALDANGESLRWKSLSMTRSPLSNRGGATEPNLFGTGSASIQSTQT